ncbi:type II secretion system protein N [Desulfuromusa kysingii]|uniref:Type II secretion system protein N n=1 Tax=Desulfuromusa kysingii TaxID=37625 RepID=A0A1H3W4Y7_9BACT|nr:type II secretion system protein GspN [Desulfuromusa kysingii]SDZ81484.1 type II secretion system protein N [Desulfuromusa kysingii]
MNLISGWQRLAGNRRLFTLCLLLFIVSTLLSTWIFLPVDALQRRLLQEVSQQTGLEIQGRNASMLFPPGLGLDLSIYSTTPGLNDLELTDLQVTPVWHSLFTADKRLNLTAILATGHIVVDVAQSGTIDSKFNDIALAPLQKADLPYRLSGKITGQLTGENLSENMEGRGDFSFYVVDTQIAGLEKIGLPASVFAGVLRLEGRFDQRRFSLEKVVLKEGSLDLSGGGNVLVGETAEQTRLNLNVRLHPTATTPDSLLELMSLTGMQPTVDGSYLLRIGGTLAKPMIR